MPCFNCPYGTTATFTRLVPSSELLGYCQSSRWDGARVEGAYDGLLQVHDLA